MSMSHRLRPLVAALLLMPLGVGCGEESQEQQLVEASEDLQSARARVEDLRAEVEERQAEVDEAKAALTEVQQRLRQAEEKLQKAESKVDLRATDAALFRAVQKRLLEAKELRKVAIDADVQKGVVQLRGVVPDRETHDRAVEIARSVPGVARVDSRMVVTQEKVEAAEEKKP